MPDDSIDEAVELTVSEEDTSVRLDAFLAKKIPQHSRVKLRRAITAGGVLVDGERTKVAYRLNPGQVVTVVLPELPKEGPEPEEIPLDIVYEDEHLAAINKPSGMVVHPSKGHWSGTLTAALAFHFDSLSTAGGPTRPGIVHRLDRDTSGVIVVAKTDEAHLALAAQFEARTTKKQYFAITVGVPDRDRDMIEQPIGMHPYQRDKMAIRAGHSTSRDARTFYEVDERFKGFAAIKVQLHTGRTHQIRVHLTHIGCPVLCDRLYGGRSQITRGELSGDKDDDKVLLKRQALHAQRLELQHPVTKAQLVFEAPLPPDIQCILDTLRQYRRLSK
jgi:23S rRNA pseudouridine1911/1915/1917 synthase